MKIEINKDYKKSDSKTTEKESGDKAIKQKSGKSFKKQNKLIC